MNEKFRQLILEAKAMSKEGDYNAPTAVWVEQFGQLVVEECAELIRRHARQLESYNFTDKANTAHTCSGIITEHFSK